MGKKGYISIYIDKEVARKARELGLNISKTCENALKEAIRRLEAPDCKERSGNCDCGEPVVRPPGFEPGSSAWQAGILVQARLRPLLTP